MIRKGEAIGMLTNPQDFFDKLTSANAKEKLQRSAQAIASIIKANGDREREERMHHGHAKDLQEDCSLCYPEKKDPDKSGQGHGSSEEEEEDYGPKTAAMPDPEKYDSQKLRELIDVGSLPEHLKEEAWNMLEKRVKAFGFDGRLGHHPTKVHIRTLDGQVPIAVPM
jgi:hypothetical protein